MKKPCPFDRKHRRQFTRVPIAVICVIFGLPLWARAVSLPAQQAYVKPSAINGSEHFGYSVAIAGDTMVVGAPFDSSNATGVNGEQTNAAAFGSGAAYVFVREGTNWSQQAYLKASDTSAFAEFGSSVAASGDIVVVAARGAEAAYVFARAGTNWTQEAFLQSTNPDSDEGFGCAVAVSGDTITVGACRNNTGAYSSGAVYVFKRHGTNWSQQAILKAANPDSYDTFGISVAISGDTIVAGAIGEASSARGVNGNPMDNDSPYSGAAYVFVRSGTNWIQESYLKSSNSDRVDYFGLSVGVSGDSIVVGAYGEDSNATGVNGDQSNNLSDWSGAAYVFTRAGTNWSQEGYLKASNTGRRDNFGYASAIWGNTIVIGAAGEDSNATAVNGTGSDPNPYYDSGAAYVFVRSGTNWSQRAYLKASNAQGGPEFGPYGDGFGFAVAVCGDTVVAGSELEDSSATGLNGNQNDNTALDSGAAYVFTGLGAGPALEINSDGVGGYVVRCHVIAGFTYLFERTAAVNGVWTTNEAFTATSSGMKEFRDSQAPFGQMFYRVTQQ